MSARKVVIGCSVTAVAVVAAVVISGIVAFKYFTAVVPLPQAASLIDADTVGLTVVRLDPDNPWIKGAYDEISKYSVKQGPLERILPFEMIWSARRLSPAAEGHILSFSLSPSGRFFGLVSDFALWRAGRSGKEKVARVEYGGEGITSFPGTAIKGHLFVRDTTAVWASDLDTARQAVDLLVSHEKAGEPAPALPPSLLALLPPGSGHTAAGAILNQGGSLARSLALVPGSELDITEESVAPVAGLSFVFDTTSADEGAGEVILHFLEGTPPGMIQKVAGEFATRLAAVKVEEVHLEITPRLESARAALSVKAFGLESLRRPLIQGTVKKIKVMERAQEGDFPDESSGERQEKEEPDQSSSTFQ